MSHQDQRMEIVANCRTIKQVIDWLLPAALFRGLRVRKGSAWKPRLLATVALLWGALEDEQLEERFRLARKVGKKLFPWLGEPGKTYEGFKKVLKRWDTDLKLLLMEQWHAEMIRLYGARWTIAGFPVFATDGSRIELPRTKSHEEAYAPSRKSQKRSQATRGRKKKKENKECRRRAKKQEARRRAAAQKEKRAAASAAKKAGSPQMWLTLLWHVGSGLPWSWRTGPSDSSERAHFEQMLPELPKNSLITADAGFVGYDFWKAILDARHHFLIRVGGNVKLIKKLGYAREYEHVVYLWPDAAAKRHQPPLVLRLIVLHDGKQPVYLVTDLPKSELNDQQAATIYAARWGIELFFRTFKQTFGRRKLRSHNAQNAALELDWSLLALWGILLVGQRELMESGQEPQRQSPAKSIRAFQTTIRDYRVRPESANECLWTQLRTSLLDNYQRNSTKTSRDYPRKKQRERTAAPKIIQATRQQIHDAQEVKQLQQKIRLAA